MVAAFRANSFVYNANTGLFLVCETDWDRTRRSDGDWGERIMGCLTCNLWARLPEEDIRALHLLNFTTCSTSLSIIKNVISALVLGCINRPRPAELSFRVSPQAYRI